MPLPGQTGKVTWLARAKQDTNSFRLAINSLKVMAPHKQLARAGPEWYSSCGLQEVDGWYVESLAVIHPAVEHMAEPR